MSCTPDATTVHHRVVGFTLIELLVVIAVIGILAGLLMPTLVSAMNRASLSTCAQNLSSIYKGMRQYAPYYDNHLPNLFHRTNPSGLIARYRSSQYFRAGPFPSDGAIIPYGLSLLKTQGYIDEWRTFYCPSAPASEKPGGASNVVKNGIPAEASYWYNFWPTNNLEAPKGVQANRLSNCFSITRSVRFSALIGDRFPNSATLPHAAHNGTNVCYWDGSTVFVDLDTHPIAWNTTAGGGRAFTMATTGAEAVRDSWLVLSRRH